MPEPTEYVVCKFSDVDKRTYTYRNDGDPVAVGDMVKVPDNRSEGWKRVKVVAIHNEKPSFDCKAILGKIEPEKPVDQLDLGEDRNAPKPTLSANLDREPGA